MCLLIVRSEESPTLAIALSEESKRRRHRKTKINIRLNVFAWALEFLAGLTTLIIYVCSRILGTADARGADYGRIFQLFYIGFWGIIIPSSYILKTEEVRNKIINNQLVNPFRNILQA